MVALYFTIAFLGGVASFMPSERRTNRPIAFVAELEHPVRCSSTPTNDGKSKTEVSSKSLPSDVYSGPILDPEAYEGMTAALHLAELGIDVAVGKSLVSPGQLGLFVRCSDNVDSVSLPECTLLCGYAKPGTFLNTDVGDGCVFERQLMEVGHALQLAASEFGNGACGLAGHELSMNEEEVLLIRPVEGGFDRYFCPDLVNSDHVGGDIIVQNFGQFCNDLAWDSVATHVVD
jgi:hypothetical protein